MTNVIVASLTMIAEIQGVERVEGKLEAPPSKSYTHRAFILALLATGKSRIVKPLLSEDTLATLNGVKAFGAGVERESEAVEIHGTAGNLASPEFIDCKNSGTTLRLLMGVAALNGTVVLTGDNSLRQRPVAPLAEALSELGVGVEYLGSEGKPPVKIRGANIKGGRVRIRGDVSSQFISSLLIISPYAEEGMEIEITSEVKSKPYIDITVEMMRSFGVEVEKHDYRLFRVKSSGYSGREFKIEGDFSSISYFVALAAAKGKVEISNLNKNSLQGDKKILEIVRNMGAEVSWGKNLTVEKGELQGISVDLSDTPDLLPTVAVLGALAQGKTEIYNVEHARFKESDRISTCVQEISKFGVKIEERRDGMVIEGRSKLKGADVNSHGDHRIAMALSVLALCSEGKTRINNADCVSISYPEFYSTLKRLTGGVIRWI